MEAAEKTIASTEKVGAVSMSRPAPCSALLRYIRQHRKVRGVSKRVREFYVEYAPNDKSEARP